MNSFEILQAMNEIPGEDILAARDRLGYGQECRTEHRRMPKRFVLLAAIVALIALLVGCAVAYVLNLQSMKVGEYSYHIPDAYDDEGNLIPADTRPPATQLSLQGVNMDALAEWVAFTNSYDPDLVIAAESDRTGSAWKNIPDNYHHTYGCYSQEMVDKLDEIVEKYDLKLLSDCTICQSYESDVLLNMLGLEGLLISGGQADAEYGGGYFFPEGTFNLSVTLHPNMDDWQLGKVYADYRYSVKEFFDPVTGTIHGIENCKQWNYTRADGQTVLLVHNENTARIYADLPDAFVSIWIDPTTWVGGETAPLTAEALEQVAELFDLSAKPQEVDMSRLPQLQAEAQAKQDAKFEAKKAEFEEKTISGYEEFVRYRLEQSFAPENLFYIHYDVNGDGVEELVINGLDILSLKDGQSYQYFSLASVNVTLPDFFPCENNVFEVCSEFSNTHFYYFYQADAETADFITGLVHNTTKDIWYLSPDGSDNLTQITQAEAQHTRDTYKRIDVDWLPLKKYGMDVASIHYTDPYAKYIASKLERYDNGTDFEYTLLDVDGNGVDELIARDVYVQTNGEEYTVLSIHTIKDGKTWEEGGEYIFTYVCEGGILEETLDFAYADDGDGDIYHSFYKWTEDGAVFIEKISKDRLSGRWSHTKDEQDRKIITKEKAAEILASYQRLELDMKSFAEYPFK